MAETLRDQIVHQLPEKKFTVGVRSNAIILYCITIILFCIKIFLEAFVSLSSNLRSVG